MRVTEPWKPIKIDVYGCVIMDLRERSFENWIRKKRRKLCFVPRNHSP